MMLTTSLAVICLALFASAVIIFMRNMFQIYDLHFDQASETKVKNCATANFAVSYFCSKSRSQNFLIKIMAAMYFAYYLSIYLGISSSFFSFWKIATYRFYSQKE